MKHSCFVYCMQNKELSVPNISACFNSDFPSKTAKQLQGTSSQAFWLLPHTLPWPRLLTSVDKSAGNHRSYLHEIDDTRYIVQYGFKFCLKNKHTLSFSALCSTSHCSISSEGIYKPARFRDKILSAAKPKNEKKVVFEEVYIELPRGC